MYFLTIEIHILFAVICFHSSLINQINFDLWSCVYTGLVWISNPLSEGRQQVALIVIIMMQMSCTAACDGALEINVTPHIITCIKKSSLIFISIKRKISVPLLCRYCIKVFHNALHLNLT